MAERRWSKLNTERYESAHSVHLSDWTSSKDSDSHRKRSKIMKKIMRNCTITDNQSMDHLWHILESEWDVNEALDISDYTFPRTALHEAASRAWTEGVRMLLNAGAKCVTSDEFENPLALALQHYDCPQFENPLALALQHYDCPPNLIDLLLEHGADPNDHDEKLKNIPLLNAIIKCGYGKNGTVYVQLLLEHGANPNIAHRVNVAGNTEVKYMTALHEAAKRGLTDIMKILLDAGAICTTADAGQNLLVPALKNYDCQPDLIEKLLKHGANPTTADAGQNLLVLALQNNDCQPDLTEKLLKHGVNPNDHDDLIDNIPLLQAINRNQTIIVKLLLQHGANPNVAHRKRIHRKRMERDGEAKWVHRTALQEAAKLRKNEVVKMLLEAGANSDTSALYEAARLGLTDMMKILLDAGAKCTTADASQNLLALALQNEDCQPDLIEQLLKHGVNPNDHDDHIDNIPLLRAIKVGRYLRNQTIIVKLLLQHGANPNVAHRKRIHRKIMERDGEAKCVHRTALQEAATFRNNEVVKMLLEAGANSDTSVLYKAAASGLTDMVKILLDAGAKCTTADAGQNLLALALQNDDCQLDLIEQLLKHGVNPNDHDDDIDNIPLLQAIENCWDRRVPTAVLKLLLHHGANPNVAHGGTMEGDREAKWVHRTALHEAAASGWTEGVKILLDAGAKCTTFGPLILAVRNRDCPPELIKLLLEHGADPNDHDDQLHNIPLLKAIDRFPYDENDIIVIKLLLEHGANPNVTHRVNIGEDGEVRWVHRTALHEASQRRYGMVKMTEVVKMLKMTEVVKMLVEAGAKAETSVLHEAVKQQSVEKVKILLDAKSLKSEALQNTLTLALRNAGCPLDIIKLLLKHGADPNDHDDQPENIPLFNAIKHYKYCENDTAIIQLLLDAGAKCKTSGALPNPLMLALQNPDCHPDLVKLLLKHGADPNRHTTDKDIPLLYAIMNCSGNLHLAKIVNLLLETGANRDVEHKVDIGRHGEVRWVQRTALHEAVQLRLTEVVKTLLDAGAGCKAFNGSEKKLELAVQNRCPPDLIELLLNHAEEPTDHDRRFYDVQVFHVIEHDMYGESGTKIVNLFLEHGANPNATHKVNLGTERSPKWIQRTALHAAVMKGWIKGVQMLLEAGAKCKVFGAVENPLMLALKSNYFSTQLIELLLKHGADPNYHMTDRDIPLTYAFKKHLPSAEIVPLLLEHGANPNVTHRGNMGTDTKRKLVHRKAIHEAVELGWTEGVEMLLDAGAKCTGLAAFGNPLMLALQNTSCPPELIELLLQHGADTVTIGQKLQQLSRYMFQAHPLFYQHLLDSFFLHGGNINMEDGNHETALEHAVQHDSHSNRVRWLIRHGADTALRFTLLKGYFKQSHGSHLLDTPLILLQAGMRVSHGAQTQLVNMEVAISTWLQDDTLERENINRIIQGISEEAQGEELSRRQQFFKKSSIPEYWTRQMVDLQEFSDVSLQVYPEDTYISHTRDTTQKYQDLLDQVHRVLEVLSQPQSLQWYCRRCVRENLVSLQPSVVKTLPGPSRLKRYILCHEI